jgi:high-affinity iron transporter
MQFLRLFASLLFVLAIAPSYVHAADTTVQDKAKQIWQLLDYLAVDYGKAVQDGKVISPDEYAEMQEFAHAAETQLKELPPGTSTSVLLKGAQALRAAISAKAPPATVADHARKTAVALVAAYPIPMAPAKAPDLQQGARLYQNNCASCHGATGHADGPLAAKLSPPPVALADHARAQERSVFSLYQIITQGVKGTSMAGFANMTESERWDVAFFAATLSYSEQDRRNGAKLWTSDSTTHTAVPTLGKLSQTTEAQLAATMPVEKARPLLAYLRSKPEVLGAPVGVSIVLAKERLRESLAALEKGDVSGASKLGLSAYLDGFEPVEPALKAKNKGLFEDIEKTMGSYRNAVNNKQLPEARDIEKRLQILLTEANGALTSNTDDPLSTYIGALTILLREGLEALLVVVAMVAFLKKADRRDVLPYVHGGWVAALAAGGVTWGVATYVVDVSGASREMTEGFSAIFAAVVLLSVGIWMHQKSVAGRWQAYVKQKLSAALNKRSAMMLFVLSFVTVYREVFETVLFYAALWTEGNGIYLLAGLGTGVAILSVIAVILLRSSARLPIGKFFAFSSALVAILATVLMGKGVAALQKVGIFDMTPIAGPHIELLGLYPSVQTVLAQIVIVLVIVASVAWNLRSQKKSGA